MPGENRVSISITPEDQAAINEAIQTLRTKLLPYLISLSPEERRTLPKISDKTIAFVTKVIGYVTTNPEFSPPYLSAPELKKDVEAVTLLRSFFTPLEQYTIGLDDTMMEAGSEAYVMALSYYNSVKQAAKMNVPVAKSIYEDLRERFPQKTGKPEPVPVS